MTYRQRVALAAGAVVTVEVRDVSVADAASVTVAEQVLRPDHQVPIPFSIDVAPGRLVAGRRYGVAARIDVDGHLAWISDTHHPVATTRDDRGRDRRRPCVAGGLIRVSGVQVCRDRRGSRIRRGR